MYWCLVARVWMIVMCNYSYIIYVFHSRTTIKSNEMKNDLLFHYSYLWAKKKKGNWMASIGLGSTQGIVLSMKLESMLWYSMYYLEFSISTCFVFVVGGGEIGWWWWIHWYDLKCLRLVETKTTTLKSLSTYVLWPEDCMTWQTILKDYV